MRNKEKILKQNSLRSGINIKIVLLLVGLSAAAWFVYAFGASFSSLVAVVCSYFFVKQVWRFFRLVLALVFTIVSILILLAIISILII